MLETENKASEKQEPVNEAETKLEREDSLLELEQKASAIIESLGESDQASVADEVQ